MRLLLLVLAVSVASLSGSARQAKPWVVVEDANGREIMSFVSQDVPYAPGVLHRVLERFEEPPNVVDKSGRVISALKYYGWQVGAVTHVVVLADVPVEGAQNQVYPNRSPQLRTVELARYELRAGAAQQFQDLGKSLSRTLRITTRDPRVITQ